MSNNHHEDGINGGIIRVEHDRHHPYRTINTSFAQDSRLTWAARGVLVYLLSKPDGWQLRVGDLINQSPAGRDAVYAILRNLESCGYLERIRSRRLDGTFEHTNIVYEVARETADSPLPDYPDTDYPDTDNPYADNPEVDDFRGDQPLPDEPEAVQPLAVKPSIYKLKSESTKEGNTKDTTTTTRARAPVPALRLVRGGGGGDDYDDGDDGDGDDGTDACEIEPAPVRQAELVDQLVAIGVWHGKAMAAVSEGVITSEQDIVCCKRYLATSTATNPPAVLVSQFLSQGLVPKMPQSSESTVTPAVLQARDRLQAELEATRGQLDPRVVDARAAIARVRLRPMPAGRPVFEWATP